MKPAISINAFYDFIKCAQKGQHRQNFDAVGFVQLLSPGGSSSKTRF